MNGQPRVLGRTLARGGSKSVPMKTVRPNLGILLIPYTIAESPFLRPAELATDTAHSLSALQHVVSWVEQEEGRGMIT